MTEILKNYHQSLTNPNGKIDFENENLKTYLFLQRPLEHTPISIALLKEGFLREIIITIMNIYLSHLEKINSESICQELIKVVKQKTRNNESTKQIGFAI